MHSKLSVLAVGCCVVAGTAQAACPGDTQLEMNMCAQDEFYAADADLTALWPEAAAVMERLGHGAALLDAQTKWLAYRDAACALEIAPFEGGSIQPMIWFGCLTRLTQNRIQDLENLRFN